jgi:hypothetical protein
VIERFRLRPLARALRALLKRSRAFIIAVMLARDARLGVLECVAPSYPVKLGARHQRFSLTESVDYVTEVAADYFAYGGLTDERVRGARVLEVGPGDSLGVALLLIGLGARQVVCLDRFVTWRDPQQQRRINRELAARMAPDERSRAEHVLTPRGDLRPGQTDVVVIEGTGIEDASRLFTSPFDVIVSRAVLAHVWEPEVAFRVMDELLADDGLMAHKVDLSDHRLFSDAGHNPLTFLTIPDWLWDRMRRHTALTNRRLADYYRAQFRALGYEAELLVTRLIGEPSLPTPRQASSLTHEIKIVSPKIDEIRPRLLARYRDLDDADLATAGIFAKARKPADSGRGRSAEAQ